jgi:nucleotide-binding universal stress UspA family protein
VRILVGYGARAGAPDALEHAISLANGCADLTILSTVVPPLPTIWLVRDLPIDPWQLAEATADSLLRDAARTAPPEIGVTTLLRRGALSSALMTELRRNPYDVVVVGGARRRDAQRLLRRAGVPAIFVPGGRGRRRYGHARNGLNPSLSAQGG